jgi:hypothetical protein
MIEKFGGRKFIVAILGLIIMVAIVFLVPDMRQAAMEQIKYIIASYVVANAIKGGMEEINKK